VGADHVVFPEHEAGCNLAQSLTKPGILERLALDEDSSIVEVIAPEGFHGKTITQLQLRSNYGVNLIAFSQDGKFVVNPDPTTPIQKGMAIVVIGANADIDRLPI
jgi:trk system potassium uptake protein